MTRKLSQNTLELIHTNEGRNLWTVSHEKPVLMVFLRHFGCVFCRAAMNDIGTRRERIEGDGYHIVLVHMADNALAEKYFRKFNLEGCSHISDPHCEIYAMFGLVKGSLSQLFGLKTMVRGFAEGFSMRQFGGAPFGDAFQMPGIFVIHKGQVEGTFIYETISDRPDYNQLLACCTSNN